MLPNPFIQSCARCARRHCARKSFISWSLWAEALSSLFCRDYQILCFKEFDYQNALIVQKRILKLFQSRIFRNKKPGFHLRGGVFLRMMQKCILEQFFEPEFSKQIPDFHFRGSVFLKRAQKRILGLFWSRIFRKNPDFHFKGRTFVKIMSKVLSYLF